MLPQDRETAAFSLVEVLLVVTLLSLIVLALMAVFSGTQRAFRAGVTQTDVLEGGRLATEQIANDLRCMTPSGGTNFGAVNFFAMDNSYSPALNYLYSPLPQTLPPGTTNRLNWLQYFFILGRENTRWTGVGYVVNFTNQPPMYPLYRFYAETNVSEADPRTLFDLFMRTVDAGQWTNATMSHVADGVIHLAVHAYDPSGRWQTNGYVWNQPRPANVLYIGPVWPWGDIGFYFFSNTVPAAVEVEIGILEDATLARAASIPVFTARTNYLAGHAGAVHLFRQRVNIPNVDRTAYP